MKISVVICLPEVIPHFQEHLESLIAQTRPPDELIFCNAGSTHKTLEIAQSFAAKATLPVRFNPTGEPDLVESAIKLCEGDLIIFSEQDNVWFPEKLLEITDAFSESPESGLVLADAELVDESSRPLGCSLWECIGFGPREQKAFKDKKKLTGLLRHDAIASATMVFRSTYKHLILPFRKNISHTAWIALVACAVGQISLIRTSLSNYRLHAEKQFGPEAINGYGDNGLAEELFLLRLVAERLALNERSERVEEASELAGRIGHLVGRSNLPAERSKRIPYILKELLTLRYHLYSYGFNSALKDILVPPERNC